MKYKALFTRNKTELVEATFDAPSDKEALGLFSIKITGADTDEIDETFGVKTLDMSEGEFSDFVINTLLKDNEFSKEMYFYLENLTNKETLYLFDKVYEEDWNK